MALPFFYGGYVFAFAPVDMPAKLDSGISATGVIQTVKQTGTWINENPEVEVAVQVTPEGQPSSYEAKRTFVVRVIHVPLVQPGKALKLHVDPADRMHIVLNEDWAK
jgi:hypothetical protein